MSEFQFYEFRAIDRPLTAKEQAKLRSYSSHATITSSRFAVDYAWGDFRGDAAEWMEKYFDAFVHLANWGTHELMLRLPRTVLPLETARKYCAGGSASARAKGDHVVLAFLSDDEGGGEWIDEDDDTLASLLPLRAELASGDLRALYLGWLGSVQAGECRDEDAEPPCPPGLGKLSPALEALADFLRVDPDLIDAAAAGSPKPGAADDAALEAWVAALPEAEKTALLLRLVGGEEARLRGELLRRFREARSQVPAGSARARTVKELLAAAESQGVKRERQEAERAERERARREREAAAAREPLLAALARREAEAWRELDALIATRLPKEYDRAVSLLRDLREVCARDGRLDEAHRRIAALVAKHAKKQTFVDRLRKAALI